MKELAPYLEGDVSQQAANELAEWCERYLRVDTKLMVILDRPDRTLSITLCEDEIDLRGRLEMIARAADAITSHRAEATHSKRKFE